MKLHIHRRSQSNYRCCGIWDPDDSLRVETGDLVRKKKNLERPASNALDWTRALSQNVGVDQLVDCIRERRGGRPIACRGKDLVVFTHTDKDFPLGGYVPAKEFPVRKYVGIFFACAVGWTALLSST